MQSTENLFVFQLPELRIKKLKHKPLQVIELIGGEAWIQRQISAFSVKGLS